MRRTISFSLISVLPPAVQIRVKSRSIASAAALPGVR
jgi:hypothetical protein